jgi:signal transduction histidine kinase
VAKSRVSGTDTRGERLEKLVRAGIRIYSEHRLEQVLQLIVNCAREVIGARYAALGILNLERTGLGQFVASGLSPERQRKIGPPPAGKGILGLLIKDPRPLRLADLTKHPASYGFPPHHPRMRSFLGVPVVGREGPIGNLYLTEKLGAAEFTEEDESIAVLLAGQAAAAVENARLHEETARLLKELRALQQSRDRFYAMINHELRNSLTAVYGWADLLVRRAGTEAPRAALEVYECAERTLALLNDLLDLSKLDASRLQPVIRSAEANQLAREAIRTVEPAAQGKGIKIEVSAPERRIQCRTDPQRVRQILVNLLSNAVRHSPEGEAVTIEIQATDSRLEYRVIDRGEGLSEEEQATIFEAFAGGERQEHRGTGLGLALSRQLARLLGGDLSVKSKKGCGATFILQIARHLDRT